ncbi:MAG: serine acetyltransferase CysE [Bacteroidetes bacterium HLUCCA01]|nr:MAG: serine acetyltransferase CysE [Bacteroidetes bacterium HLUCCA01]
MDKIYIYGAGSVGKLVAQIISDINAKNRQWEIAGFIDDDEAKLGQSYAGFKILGGSKELAKGSSVIIGFSKPIQKKKVAEKLNSLRINSPTLIHPSAWLGERVKLGKGTVIYPGVCIDCDVVIGEHATINKNATFGHDSYYGNYITLSPGVNLGGFLEVGEGVEFGIGACTIQKLKIGNWTKIGAGAVVTKDLPANCTAVGIPAKPIKFHIE